MEFDGVYFAYDSGHPVLEDVTFLVEPGQTVALVGPTGAGKTTIASLIPRFYDVTGGAVRVDGHDVREVTRRSLRSHIATVLQEPFLFSGTIAENIGYGRAGDEEPPTREEIEAAARTVEAHNFISDLPEGYETVLGEGGGSLSQGQRQLLAFARAVLADPRVLILDEATSNIDTRTEAAIQAALGRLLAGRTSVVIAHRLSTIRDSDRILGRRGRPHRRTRDPRRAADPERPLRRPLPSPVPPATPLRPRRLSFGTASGHHRTGSGVTRVCNKEPTSVGIRFPRQSPMPPRDTIPIYHSLFRRYPAR